MDIQNQNIKPLEYSSKNYPLVPISSNSNVNKATESHIIKVTECLTEHKQCSGKYTSIVSSFTITCLCKCHQIEIEVKEREDFHE